MLWRMRTLAGGWLLTLSLVACSGSDPDDALLGPTGHAGSSSGGALGGGGQDPVGGSAGKDPAGGSGGAGLTGGGGMDPAGSSGAGLMGGGGNPVGGSAGKPSGGSGGKPSGGSGGATCVGGEQPARRAPLDLVILMDRSGSMSAGEKWPVVTSALGELVKSLEPSARVSLRYMSAPASKPPPSTCTTDLECGEYGPCLAPFMLCTGSAGGAVVDSCDPADYVAAVVPLTPQAQATAAITQSLLAHKADGGGSPVFAALFGTLQDAVETQKLRPEATTRVLFATDGGEPSGCTKNKPAEVAAVAKAGWDTGRVRTFIAGLGAAEDLPSTLEPVAVAGGSKKVRVMPPGSSVAQVTDAMRAVVPRCTFALPEAASYTLVRRGAGGDVSLPPVGVLAACTGEGYWLDDPQSPHKIELCPVSCEALAGPGEVVVKSACP